MSRSKKIIISIVSSILILVLAFIGVYFFWPWHREFFNNSDAEFTIPGLDTNFCPQGMTELEGYNKYIVCGYMNDGSPSRYYVIDGESNKIEKYFILNIDNKLYNGHAGGVASYKGNIWTVSYEKDSENDDGFAFRFLASDVIKVENGGEVIIKDYFKTLNGADFVFVDNNILWVGEFYRAENYETDMNHRLVTRSGETNPAVVYGYKIDESYRNCIASTVPVKALSIRGLCQGMAMTSDGKFVMSTSYSIPNSHIYYYKDVLNEQQHGTIYVGTNEVPLWYLDDDALISSKEIPSMSEEIFIKNNRVYVLFESACKKYKLYNRVRIKNVYSFALNYLED